jgi:large subunit ribosomal protein L17
MRHQAHHGRLGVQPSHRRAMIRNMVTSLLKHERIKTTKTRAKEVRRYAEKMITLAKKETLAAKRDVLGFVREREVVNKLFKTLIYRYSQRKGGYTRILKLGYRAGDGADMVFLELVDRPTEEKTTETTVDKKKKPKSLRQPLKWL